MIYFDNSATTSYKPKEVINAVKNCLEFLSANPGRGGHSMSTRAGFLVHKTREKAANYLGVKNSERVIFTHNCTAALNTAILGTVKSGGHVITTAYEHNSVLRPLFELQRKGIISLTVIAPNDSLVVDLDMIKPHIRRDTYMICTNHISNVTGAKTDVFTIGKFCRQNKILYLVDGAQSVGYGSVLMDDLFIDLLSVAPHKGLHAPQGIGILAIGGLVNIKPVVFGGTGTDSESVFQPLELPEALESGTVATPAIAGLNSALSWSEKNREPMCEKINELSKFLQENLRKINNISLYTPKNAVGGITAFNVDTLTSVEVSDILSEHYDICTRGSLHCAPLIHKHLGTLEKGIVRVSLGYENTYAQVNEFLTAVKEIAK